MENILQWNWEKSTTNSADFFENLVRESARKMLAAALESEVDQFIQKHKHKLDADGHRTVVSRRLEGKEYVYVWADGVYCNVRLEVLRDLKFRGLTTAPKLAICDGALGFQNAVDKVWGQMKIQRCWFHKMGNVLAKMPECVQSAAKKKLQDIFLADTKQHSQDAYQHFIDTYDLKYPKTTECLAKDYDDLFGFYYYPAEHWVHIRTSYPIESMFATVRLRHRSTKGNGSADATLTMVFKLCKEAEKNWRRLKGFEKLQLEDKNYNEIQTVKDCQVFTDHENISEMINIIDMTTKQRVSNCVIDGRRIIFIDPKLEGHVVFLNYNAGFLEATLPSGLKEAIIKLFILKKKEFLKLQNNLENTEFVISSDIQAIINLYGRKRL